MQVSLRRWVVADSVYGSNRPLRVGLEKRLQPYALAVRCCEKVTVQGESKRVDCTSVALPTTAWQRHSAGEGSKGPCLFDWGCVELDRTAETPSGWKHCLLIRRSLHEGEKAAKLAYFLIFAPTETTLQQMVQAVGARWTVESCFEEGKGEVGLDHYEVRTFQGWYRHITLCMLAHAFLAVLRAHSQTIFKPEKATRMPLLSPPQASQEPTSFQPALPASSLPMMVPLSLPEIRRLFFYLLQQPPLPLFFRPAWSAFRLTHQAAARLFHSKRRLAAPT